MLSERGYAVAMIDLNGSADTLASIQNTGAEALDFAGDVSDEATVTAFVEAITTRWGRADVLVNNAGISFIQPAETVSVADFRKVLEVNLVAPFLLSKGVRHPHAPAGSGSHRQRSLHRWPRRRLRPLRLQRQQTRPHRPHPHPRGRVGRPAASGPTPSAPAGSRPRWDVADQAGGGYTDADIGNRVPMGRFAKPEEIAQAICFLADPTLSGFINGQTLAVDGGWTADGSWETLRLRKR